MAEAILYLNENCHTGHFREASYELNNRTRDIADKCLSHIGQINPVDNPKYLFLKMRMATGPGSFRLNELSKWKDTEEELAKLLRIAHLCRNPQHIWILLSEHLPHVDILDNFPDARGYFSLSTERIGYLLSEKAKNRLGSLKLASYSYTESLILRKAVYQGIYLLQNNRN